MDLPNEWSDALKKAAGPICCRAVYRMSGGHMPSLITAPHETYRLWKATPPFINDISRVIVRRMRFPSELS